MSELDKTAATARLWTPDQLQVMRGLGIPAWVGAGLSVQAEPAMLPEAKAQPADHALPVVAMPAETSIEPVAVVAPHTPPATTTQSPPAVAAPAPHSLDWAALATAAQQCQACGLCADNQRLPLGMGATQAGGALIVLDAAYSSAQGLLEPAAQTLLANILASVGMSFDNAYVTSTVKCGAPASLAVLDPLGANIAACAPFLERQIVLKQAPLIIAMGQGAAQALMALDEPLAALRGELHGFECQDYAGQLLVTHHPQALLDAPDLKRETWQDLCLAIEVGLLQSQVASKAVKPRSK
jgi:uracil-DNA glycosylase